MKKPNSTSKVAPSKPKPYKDFPLFHHKGSNQWAKKVRGKTLYFGTDATEACNKWLQQKDFLLAGMTPRVIDPDALTVKRLCFLFLDSKDAEVKTGELTQRTFDEYKVTCKELTQHLGAGAVVEHLTPDDFRKLRVKFAKGVGVKTLSNRIIRTRVVLNFADESGLLNASLRKMTGREFKRPSKAAVERSRGETDRTYTREEILALLASALPQMKAMILLAINGGYGPTDLSLLEIKNFDFQGGWLTRKRNKTGTKRRTPLWPETIAAVKAVIESRLEPKEPSDCIFITRCGQPWTVTARANPISQEFGKLKRALKIEGERKGIYTLRHMLQTIGDETREYVAVKYLMGHTDDSMSGQYREFIKDDRLLTVTNHVRTWLFGGAS